MTPLPVAVVGMECGPDTTAQMTQSSRKGFAGLANGISQQLGSLSSTAAILSAGLT